MDEQIQASPTPQKIQDAQILLTFPDAMREVMNNKKITRIEWDDKGIFGVLLDGLLMIRLNERFERWIISDGDLFATDWVTIE